LINKIDPHQRRTLILPLLLGLGSVLALFGKLVDYDSVLVTRDVPVFHLPLRTVFSNLADQGIPWWNPLINGGQPILSNPNYSAFYPPSWLGLLVAPHYALNLQVLLHALVAFLGMWKLVKRLGCSRSSCLLAGVSFIGGGGHLSMLHAITLFFSMSWLPWLIYFGDCLLKADQRVGAKGWLRYGIYCGGIISLQLLIAEPVTVLIGGLSLLALSADYARRRPRAATRTILPVLLALALAGIQLVPTFHRLQESTRAEGLDLRNSVYWSTSPARLIQMVYPHLYGDPNSLGSQLALGQNLHDQDSGYILSIYPGLIILILAVSAGCRQIPLRFTWTTMAVLGVFLALGRHNPIYVNLLAHIPPFSLIRYPEKFLLLTTFAISIAGPLGWHHLTTERKLAFKKLADLPLTLSLIAFVIPASLLGLSWSQPTMSRWFVRSNSAVELTASQIARGVQYLEREMAVSAGFALAAALIFLLYRWRGTASRLLVPAIVLLVASDLIYFGKNLITAGSASELMEPPPLAVKLQSNRSRIYDDSEFTDTAYFWYSRGTTFHPVLRERLDQLTPYAGNLWDISYWGNTDYDLMLTEWARYAKRALTANRFDRTSSYRVLGAWNVEYLLFQRDPTKLSSERPNQKTPSYPDYEFRNPYFLSRYRFAPQVVFLSDTSSALAAAQANGFELASQDYWVDTALPEGEIRIAPSAFDTRLIDLQEAAAEITGRYRASEPTHFVAAITFDRNWRARVDHDSVDLFPTAIGQIGLELPPGEHSFRLWYYDPAVVWGAVLSLISGLAAVFVLRRTRRGESRYESI
jgi:hypothetical protein